MEINFTGDVSLFSTFEKKRIDPLMEIKLPKADFTVGNFEFPIVKGHRQKYFYDVQEQYSLSYLYAEKLDFSQFTHFSLANNHCHDYGNEGAKDTLDLLQKKDCIPFGYGSSEYNISVLSKNDVTCLLIGCTKHGRWHFDNSLTNPDLFNVNKITKFISTQQSKYDHVVVFTHWGSELVYYPSINMISDARKIIDSGATAVIGHHPHVIQGYEKYKTGYIFYSLGSFIYLPEQELGAYKSKNRNISLLLHLSLEKNKVLAKSVTYELDENDKVPVQKSTKRIQKFLIKLNNNIGNRFIYMQNKYTNLVIRELICFLYRFSKAPVKAINHYKQYILGKIFRNKTN